MSSSILTSTELRADAELLAEITSVVNEAYFAIQNERRLKYPTRLVDDTGETGLIAFCRDELSGRVVATISFKPYHTSAQEQAWEGFSSSQSNGSDRKDDLALSSDRGPTVVQPRALDVELFAVANVSDERYRRQGLVSGLIDRLADFVLARMKNSDDHEQREVRMWLHIVEHINGSYWRKRGFREVSREDVPPGKWGTWGPGGAGWTMGTLVKVVRSE